MTRPDPKSFDTLEKAQAEIARCYAEVDRVNAIIDRFCETVEPIAAVLDARSAEIKRVLGEGV